MLENAYKTRLMICIGNMIVCLQVVRNSMIAKLCGVPTNENMNNLIKYGRRQCILNNHFIL